MQAFAGREIDGEDVGVVGADLGLQGHAQRHQQRRGGGGDDVVVGAVAALKEISGAGAGAGDDRVEVIGGLGHQRVDAQKDALVPLSGVHEAAIATGRRLAEGHRRLGVAVEQPHRGPGLGQRPRHRRRQAVAGQQLEAVDVVVVGAEHQVVKQLGHVDQQGEVFGGGRGVGVFEAVVEAGATGELAAGDGQVADLGHRAVEVVVTRRRRHLTQGRAGIADQGLIAVVVGKAQVLGLTAPRADVAHQACAAVGVAEALDAAAGAIAAQAGPAVLLLGLGGTQPLTLGPAGAVVGAGFFGVAGGLGVAQGGEGAGGLLDAKEAQLVAHAARRAVQAGRAGLGLGGRATGAQGAEVARRARSGLAALLAKARAQLAKLGGKHAAKGDGGAVGIRLATPKGDAGPVDALLVGQAALTGGGDTGNGRIGQHGAAGAALAGKPRTNDDKDGDHDGHRKAHGLDVARIDDNRHAQPRATARHGPPRRPPGRR